MKLIQELQQLSEMKMGLDKHEMRDILNHAHKAMKKDPDLTLGDAIGMQLENIPGLEGLDHDKIIKRIESMSSNHIMKKNGL